MGEFRKIVYSKTFPSPDSLYKNTEGTGRQRHLHGCPAHEEHVHWGPQGAAMCNTYFLRLSWKPSDLTGASEFSKSLLSDRCAYFPRQPSETVAAGRRLNYPQSR